MRPISLYALCDYARFFYERSLLQVKVILVHWWRSSRSHEIYWDKIRRIAQFLTEDLEKNTVNYRSNYDETEKEPEVLPSQYPNILVNGAGGIAVGMATSIPPHNLGEVINGTIAFINDKNITISQLMKHVPGPDFSRVEL